MTYQIHGGNHGKYKISYAAIDAPAGPVAFVSRNQKGGGYTVKTANETRSVQMRHLPIADNSESQADQIMRILMGEE